MKIEVGKTYKTRGGDKVEIYSYKSKQCNCWIGGIYYTDRWVGMSWGKNGRFGSKLDLDNDIISEWVEPVKFTDTVSWVKGKCDLLYPVWLDDVSFNWDDLEGKRGKLTFEEHIE